MLGDQRVIEYLNSALKHELAAVNQYYCLRQRGSMSELRRS